MYDAQNYYWVDLEKNHKIITKINWSMLNIIVTNIGTVTSFTWKTMEIEMMTILPKLNGKHRTST